MPNPKMTWLEAGKLVFATATATLTAVVSAGAVVDSRIDQSVQEVADDAGRDLDSLRALIVAGDAAIRREIEHVRELLDERTSPNPYR